MTLSMQKLLKLEHHYFLKGLDEISWRHHEIRVGEIIMHLQDKTRDFTWINPQDWGVATLEIAKRDR